MKFLCRLAFLLCFATTCRADNDFFTHFDTDDFWHKLVLEPAGTVPQLTPADTIITVASTRRLQPGNLRFIAEEREEGALRYFLVYAQGGKWHILPQPALRNVVDALPNKNKDWVVYAEGMGKLFTTDIDRGMRLAGQYGVNVLLLDYPSIHSHYGAIKNYRFAYRNSKEVYKDFVPVLDTFRHLREAEVAGSGHLSLFFHSMGCNVMREIVQQHLLFLFNTHTAPWVDNLILNSACVPRHGSKQWIEQINFAKRIYVNYNNEDGVLKWARLAAFHQVLGEHPKHPAANAVFINFHTLSGQNHSNFLSLYGRLPMQAEAQAHYQALFHGGAVDVQDGGRYRRSVYRKIGWDILPTTR